MRGMPKDRLEKPGAQDMADRGFQLRLGGRSDVDHGVGGAAADKVPSPLERIDSLLRAIVIPPGGIENLPAFFQSAFEYADAAARRFLKRLKSIAAAFPADGRRMIGIIETGDRFDINHTLAIVQLQDGVWQVSQGIEIGRAHV